MADSDTIGGRHRPLRDIVCDEIRARVIHGAYAPGDHLVEDRLARELGVSRNPVREALRVLETEGFVDMIPRRGGVVATLSDAEVDEVFEVRMALEALAARLAARNATADEVAALEMNIADARVALDNDDTATIVALNTRFHEMVLDLAGNGYLRDVMRPLRGRMQWIYSRTVGTVRAQRSLAEHADLARAIASRDEDTSDAQAVAHVRAAADAYWRARGEQSGLLPAASGAP